nr:hypothetical protein [Tanacetum cinerariifolium]
MKAKLALLEASPSSPHNPKTFQLKNKGLVAEIFDWEEEEVSDDEKVTHVKVLMALIDDELTVGKGHARNGEWVDITIRRIKSLLDAVGITAAHVYVNVALMNLHEKWLTFSQGLRNANHTQTLDLEDIYGRFVYGDNLIQRRLSTKVYSKLIQAPSNSSSHTDSKLLKDYKTEYKKIKSKLALLEANSSSSTHNFIDTKVAKKVGCLVKNTCPLQVSVAGGKTLVSTNICPYFVWKLQGETFSASMMTLSLGGCDMVLGVQWLSTLGDIQFNFQHLKMVFDYKGKTLILRGTTKPVVQWMNGKQVAKTGNQASKLDMCVYLTAMLNMLSISVPTTENSGIPNTPSVLNPLIEEFADVFEVPNYLPPKRGHGHKIPLKEGTQPINMRPYRHPPTQKDAIESMVKELLDSGVIRHSQSSFSSPVVMVKKKDGKLIDELHGSMVFSKLDLRSGYHQIRMFEDDIAKTAFKTHEGHYEFLVMPFGLTNAPFTFQALMNEVFRPFLRKFTLVFFDDILVYSPDMQSHVEHLRQILKVMREQQLYAKASKCTFGAQKVEYLGHIISGLGFVMTQTPVLQLLDFSEIFIIETDALGIGIGVVLQQKVIQALEKWSGYLLDRHFVIKTDHYNLKYLLDQRITTPAQIKWLPKLMGFDYDIVYKKGAENVVADALSRVQGQTECLQLEVTTLSSELYDKIKKGWSEDSQLKANIEKLQLNSGSSKHYSWLTGQLLRKGKMGALMYWKKMRNQIKQHIRQCDTCQRYKPELVPYPGLLQPLPIPTSVWAEIFMNFIDGLPMSKGRTVIMVIVDRLRDNLVDAVNRSLSAREAAIDLLKFHIKRSQNRMKSLADKHRSDMEFKEGLYRGPIPKSSSQLPQISNDGLISEEPFAVLDRKMVKKENTAVVYVLIQWVNGTAANATWETYESIAERFPHFDLNA